MRHSGRPVRARLRSGRVPDRTLEALFETDPARAAGALGDLARMLGLMHQHQGRHHGRVDVLEQDGIWSEISCERHVLDRALRDLEEAAGRDGRIAAAGTALRDRLRELADRVSPRTEYVLIHGDGDFPDRAFMQETAGHNAKEALALLPRHDEGLAAGNYVSLSRVRADLLEILQCACFVVDTPEGRIVT